MFLRRSAHLCKAALKWSQGRGIKIGKWELCRTFKLKLSTPVPAIFPMSQNYKKSLFWTEDLSCSSQLDFSLLIYLLMFIWKSEFRFLLHTFSHFHTFSKSLLCVYSSCKASGQQTWPTAHAWPSTTSTGWWPSAAQGTHLQPPLCPCLNNCDGRGTSGRLFECEGDCLLSLCVSGVRTWQFVFAETYLVCACAICQLGWNFSSSFTPRSPHSSRQQGFLCSGPEWNRNGDILAVFAPRIAHTVLDRKWEKM